MYYSTICDLQTVQSIIQALLNVINQFDLILTWVKTDITDVREEMGVEGLHKGHKPGEGGLGGLEEQYDNMLQIQAIKSIIHAAHRS